jgi:hypothetical protein
MVSESAASVMGIDIELLGDVFDSAVEERLSRFLNPGINWEVINTEGVSRIVVDSSALAKVRHLTKASPVLYTLATVLANSDKVISKSEWFSDMSKLAKTIDMGIVSPIEDKMSDIDYLDGLALGTSDFDICKAVSRGEIDIAVPDMSSHDSRALNNLMDDLFATHSIYNGVGEVISVSGGHILLNGKIITFAHSASDTGSNRSLPAPAIEQFFIDTMGDKKPVVSAVTMLIAIQQTMNYAKFKGDDSGTALVGEYTFKKKCVYEGWNPCYEGAAFTTGIGNV